MRTGPPVGERAPTSKLKKGPTGARSGRPLEEEFSPLSDLELEARPELDDAGLAGVGELTEAPAGQTRVQRRELSVVEVVERLEPKLKVRRLAELGVLRQDEV